MSGLGTKLALRTLDSVAKIFGRKDPRPEAHQTGAHGEEAAYFYVRQQGYTIVARNYRSPRRRGEIDLIGWTKDSGGDVLCFIEVKTQTSQSFKRAEAEVDLDKQRELRAMAADYLRKLSSKAPQPRYRFDVVSVYLGSGAEDITLFKDAFPLA
jgi:putative endonuclease